MINKEDDEEEEVEGQDEQEEDEQEEDEWEVWRRRGGRRRKNTQVSHVFVFHLSKVVMDRVGHWLQSFEEKIIFIICRLTFIRK